MPAPRPQWLVTTAAHRRRRRLPALAHTYPAKAVTSALPSGQETVSQARTRQEPVPLLQPSDALAQWLLSAQQFRHTFDLSGGEGAMAGKGQSLAEHLKSLTALVKGTLPLPLLQSSGDTDAAGEQQSHRKAGKPQRKGEGGHHSAQGNRRADEDASLAASRVAGLHQAQMMAITLAHVGRCRACFLGAARGERGNAARQWPWDAEVALVAALVASLPATQRETLEMLARLLTLAFASPHGGLTAASITTVCSAVERALGEAQVGKRESCLPWLVYRLGFHALPPGRGGGGVAPARVPAAVDADARKRWLALATQQLCSTAFPSGRSNDGGMSVLHEEEECGGPALGKDLPPHLQDVHTVLQREAAWRADKRAATAPSQSIHAAQDRTHTNLAEACGCEQREVAELLAQYTAGLAPLASAVPSFSPFHLLTLTEMLKSAWEALSEPGNAKKKACAEAEFHAVGVYQAQRRFASSLHRHQRLQPLLDLATLVTGNNGANKKGAEASFTSSAVQWHRVILGKQESTVQPSALLWRELALFDAYTLLTTGHVSERALDFDLVAAASLGNGPSALQRHTQRLQHACVGHLQDLTAQRERGDRPRSKIQDSITPRTRADLVARLQEALRVSTKVYLRLGDTAAICRLQEAWPQMGGSWEVGKALTAAGNYAAAMDSFSKFFADTRQQYAVDVPLAIRQIALEAVEGIGRSAREEALRGASLDGAVEQCLRQYEQLRVWHVSLPPAVCASALLRGVVVVVSPPPQPDARSLQVATRFLSELLRKGKHISDGFLTATVELLVEAWLSLRRQETVLDSLVEGEVVDLLGRLLHACPELPVLRICLTRFLRDNYDAGISALLRHCFQRSPRLSRGNDGGSETQSHLFSEMYVQALLNTFPVIALEGLSAKLAALPSSSTSLCVADALPRTVHIRLQAMVDTALQHQVGKAERESVPWECVLCHTWNNRFAAVCRLCQASRVAVVQCAACGSFGSSRDAACGACGAPFEAAPATTERGEEGDGAAEDMGSEGGSGGCAAADAILSSPSFKAVHALRPWRCHGCQHHNEASHAFYCASCGSAKPEMAATLLEGAYTCDQCNHRNSKGALRPWCHVCGSLSPKIRAAAPAASSSSSDLGAARKTLWFCVECRHLNPWLLVRCDACGAGKPCAPSPSLQDSHHRFECTVAPSPLIEVPWRVQSCAVCSAANSISAVCCRSCGAALARGGEDGSADSAAPRAIFERCLRRWRRTDVYYEDAMDEGDELAAGTTTSGKEGGQHAPRSCPYCHVALPDRNSMPIAATTGAEERVLTCLNCHAVQRSTTPAELWVCLRNGCLHVNLTPETEAAAATDSDVRCCCCCCCAGCGQARGQHITYLWKHTLPRSRAGKAAKDPLGYQAPLSGNQGNQRTSSPPGSDALVLMPTPIGPTHRCPACQTFLRVSNLLELCPACGHCGLGASLAATTATDSRSVGFRALQLRLLFHTLWTEVRKCVTAEKGRMREAQLTTFVLSTVPVVRNASETLLPWRGCDLAHDMRCGVEPRAAVLAGRRDGSEGGGEEEEEEVLHSAVAELRETIEGLCELASGRPHPQATRNTRALLLLAVELVDAMNRSTDYDEIGFPTLAKLCLAVRPEQAQHIQSETRWAYLSDMKLSREWIVNGTVCPQCLGHHERESPCIPLCV